MCKDWAMSKRHRVGVLALDGAIALDLGVPSQVFSAARDAHERRLYEVRVCTPGRRPIRSTAGFQVLPEHGLELFEDVDTVVVPGLHIDSTDLAASAEVRAALQAAAARGTRIMSICTGAFVLAAAGLLDGRPATGRTSSCSAPGTPTSSWTPTCCSSTTATC
jgi:transcriptional regulator GlxA family with amidase domain